jgi:hypothetical protein
MDPADLARKNEALAATVAQQQRVIEVLSKQVGKLLDDVARLTKKPPKGKPKKKESEPSSPDASTTTPPPKLPEPAERRPIEKPGGVPRRSALPEGLPRYTRGLPPVTCCENPWLETRDPIVRDQRDFVPAKGRIRRIELHRAECLCCGAVHTAPMLPVAMPNGSMTAALPAFIVHGKFGLHLPLVRIIGELVSKGLSVAKATVSNAMRHVAGLLGPIADRILAAIFAKAWSTWTAPESRRSIPARRATTAGSSRWSSTTPVPPTPTRPTRPASTCWSCSESGRSAGTAAGSCRTPPTTYEKAHRRPRSSSVSEERTWVS